MGFRHVSGIAVLPQSVLVLLFLNEVRGLVLAGPILCGVSYRAAWRMRFISPRVRLSGLHCGSSWSGSPRKGSSNGPSSTARPYPERADIAIVPIGGNYPCPGGDMWRPPHGCVASNFGPIVAELPQFFNIIGFRGP